MYDPTVNEKMSKINNNLKFLLTPSLATPDSVDYWWDHEAKTKAVREMKETFNSLVEHLNKTEFEVTLS